MKKFLPILFGIFLPLFLFLLILSKSSTPIELPLAETLGIKVGFGDPNVTKLTYDEFYTLEVEKVLRDKEGTFSIYIKDLSEEKVVNIGPNYTYYAASLFKIPVAIETYRLIEQGDLSLDDEIAYEEGHYYGGSGRIKDSPYGSVYTVKQLLNHLIKDSDNVAQSLLLTRVKKEDVYDLMPSPTTLKAIDVVNLLENLNSEAYLTTDSTSDLLSLMSNTSFDNRVNAGLVKGISFSHKIGNWGNTGSWHDCGILKAESDIIVCVMSKGTTFEEFLSVSAGVGRVISKLAL